MLTRKQKDNLLAMTAKLAFLIEAGDHVTAICTAESIGLNLVFLEDEKHGN